MTKPGYKQILVSIDTYKFLKDESIRLKSSMDDVIRQLKNGLENRSCYARREFKSPPRRSDLFDEQSNKNTKDNKSIDTSIFQIDKFEEFLRLKKNHADRTVESHLLITNVFLRSIKQINKKEVQNFLLNIKKKRSAQTYRNYLGTLKILLRDFLKLSDLIEDYEFPSVTPKIKILPNKQQLKTFYNSLPNNKYKSIFLLLASSGLRVSELTNCDIDRENRMLMPVPHSGETKHSFVSFYNKEAGKLIDFFEPLDRTTIAHVFVQTARKSGVKMSAHTLRSIFAREMSRSGVQDRYIDAFCGRTPQSILARHYSDFSPELLKEIYDKADIKILE